MRNENINADITGDQSSSTPPVAKSPTLRKSLKANLHKNKIISFEDINKTVPQTPAIMKLNQAI